jgi:hypothetical protein
VQNNTGKTHNTENSQQIFPEKELRGLSTNFHIHVSVSDLHIPMQAGSVFLFCCRKICGLILGIYKSLTDKSMEIGTEAVQFLYWEYKNGIFLAVKGKQKKH